jgi:hypothetical protein
MKELLMRTKTTLITGVLLLSFLLSGCAGAALAQEPTPAPAGESATTPRTVSVTGSGKVTLTPDIAYISIGVHTEGKDAAQAVASNNDQAQAVTDALQAAGIDEKDIQTTNFSIYPQQQYDTQGRPTGEITYIVDNTVFVTVRDLETVGDLLDAAVQAGANSINGIQFDVADRTKALSAARQQAMADARTQAEELAQAAGVTLGQVMTISSYTGGTPIPIAYGKGGGFAAAEAASVPVSAGQMILTVDVSVVYEIQ